MDDLHCENLKVHHSEVDQSGIGADSNSNSFRSLNGTIVHMTPHREVRLVESPSDGPLKFRLGYNDTRKLREVEKPLTIHSLSQKLEIRNGPDTLYEKPYERLMSSKNAFPWLSQLLHEQRMLLEREPQSVDETAKPRRKLRIEEKGHFVNGELKRKLFEGAYFPCNTQRKTDGTVFGQRATFRGLSINVPLSAEPSKVSIQANLVENGKIHSHGCAADAKPGNPAQRLGIQIEYPVLSLGDMEKVLG